MKKLITTLVFAVLASLAFADASITVISNGANWVVI